MRVRLQAAAVLLSLAMVAGACGDDDDDADTADTAGAEATSAAGDVTTAGSAPADTEVSAPADTEESAPDDSEGSAPAETGGETTEGAGEPASGDPLKFAALCPTTQPNYPECHTVIQAVFDEYNAQGGKDGRPLEVDFADSNDPAQLPTNINNFALDESYIAFVGNNLDAGIGPVIEEQNMANVGNNMLSADDATSPNSFTWTGWGAGSGTAAALYYIQAHEGEEYTPLVVFIDIQAGRQASDPVKAAFEAAGHPVDEAAISLTDTSFDPIAAGARANNNEPIVLFATGDQVAAITKSAQSLGLTSTIITSHTCAADDALEALGPLPGNGQLCGVPFDWDLARETIDPLMAEFGDGDYVYGFTATGAYLAGKMTVAALEQIDGEVTRESFLESMNNLQFDDPVMLAPVDFTKPGPNPDAPRIPALIYNVYSNTTGELVQESEEPVDLFAQGG